jgi:perosamine synthetase
MTTFSFHPVKHITTGEGGIVTTDDKELYEKLKLFRAHGITRDVELLERENPEPWYYEQLELGYNYRMSDIQAALGISQLKKLDGFISGRRKIVDKYNDAFKEIDEIIVPYQDPRTFSSYHLYVISLDLEKLSIGRREFFERLREKNIGVNVHYIPVYYFPYYEKLGYKKGICPTAEAFYETIVTLPLHSRMAEEEVDYVTKCITKITQKYRVDKSIE